MSGRVAIFLAGLPLMVLFAGGCIERTITITSEPAGALVWLNDREIGRTPVDVDFVHYGTYDVLLIKEGYEPLQTFGKASPPFWDNVGLDFVADLVPATLTSEIEWHYVLEVQPEDAAAARAELIERATKLRERVAETPLGEEKE